jgi:hypothetical protein
MPGHVAAGRQVDTCAEVPECGVWEMREMRGAYSGAQIEPVTCGTCSSGWPPVRRSRLSSAPQQCAAAVRRSRLSSAHSILQTVSSRRRFNRHLIPGSPLPRPHFVHPPSRVGGFSRGPTGSRGPASPPASNQRQLSARGTSPQPQTPCRLPPCGPSNARQRHCCSSWRRHSHPAPPQTNRGSSPALPRSSRRCRCPALTAAPCWQVSRGGPIL